MAYVPNSDGSQMSVPGGADPNPPSAADIARLRAAVSDMGRTIPEVTGFLSQITNIQRDIGRLLGNRSSAMYYIEQNAGQYEQMKTGSASQKAAGVPINTAMAEAWLKSSAAPLQQAVEIIDAEIKGLQDQQAKLFQMATRYLPSFA